MESKCNSAHQCGELHFFFYPNLVPENTLCVFQEHETREQKTPTDRKSDTTATKRRGSLLCSKVQTQETTAVLQLPSITQKKYKRVGLRGSGRTERKRSCVWVLDGNWRQNRRQTDESRGAAAPRRFQRGEEQKWGNNTTRKKTCPSLANSRTPMTSFFFRGRVNRSIHGKSVASVT